MSKELRIQTCIYSVYAYVSIICGMALPFVHSSQSLNNPLYIHIYNVQTIYMLESVFLTLFEHGNFPVHGRAQRGLDEVWSSKLAGTAAYWIRMNSEWNFRWSIRKSAKNVWKQGKSAILLPHILSVLFTHSNCLFWRSFYLWGFVPEF